MRLSLQSYFDLGSSFGLDDEVFQSSSTTMSPDILGIGIRNPLGLGRVVKLHEQAPALVQRWRQQAQENVHKPEMELGYDRPPNVSEEAHAQAFTTFKEELIAHIQQHPIETCELTIFAIGTVFVRLDLAPGIPMAFLYGCYKCYEFAAYSVEISQALHTIAVDTATRAASGRGDRLKTLSQRPAPDIQTDERGYQESRLFTGFSCVGLCVDATDDIPEVRRRLQEIEGQDFRALPFMYHGTLHFGWAACVLEPRTPGRDAPDAFAEMARMLRCIQIAHVFLGTCEAFEKLFQQETIHQVDSYVKGTPTGRSARDLNRLRTLALAVVSLTNYSLITAADEDQAYFAAWEQHARLSERHRRIQEQCELLYNVQDSETTREQAGREWWLNRILLLLTAFTFISVVTDSYQFIEYKETWTVWLSRMAILGGLFIVITVILVIVLYSVARVTRRD